MALRTIGGILSGIGPIVALVLLLLGTLLLLSNSTENSTRFGELYSVLLILNGLGLITMAGLIGWNFFSLIGQVRRGLAGARLTARLVTMFVVLAVTPVVVVYYFSLQFLHRGIDSWFDVRIEQALADALELGRTSLEIRMREMLKQTELIAVDLGTVPTAEASRALDDARFLSGASELTLIAPKGEIIAASSEDPTSIVPVSPDDAILLQVRQSQSYIGLDPVGENGLFVRVVLRVDNSVGDDPRILQALFPVTDRMNTLAESVQTAYAKYRELVYLRKPLKVSFTLSLSLVLLLSLFTAIWAAFFSARRLVAPLRDLVEGTQAVAGGDYATRLKQDQTRDDELGFLVESFNDMTQKLAYAHDETRRSQLQVEEQRTHLEAVLARLSSGVITLDQAGKLLTSNRAADQVLGLPLQTEIGLPLHAIAQRHPELLTLIEVLDRHLAVRSDWREQVNIRGETAHQVLMCRGAPLPVSDHPIPGHVIVFDDITTLIQAQRDAAWSEVARRLAHEIKNPLTPIQLSAERLRHKYLPRMPQEEADLLDRLTRTIVQQVESMKEMVNAFSEYAKSPQVHVQPVDLNRLISDVAELYRGESAVMADLDPSISTIDADPDRLRQVLHNLIKNGLEASTEGEKPRVNIFTRSAMESDIAYVDVTVRDQGHGFPPDLIEKIFEPYVTTKSKGTGLGLAIVKRIVEEHGGSVRAECPPGGGAAVTLRFPARATPTIEADHRRAV